VRADFAVARYLYSISWKVEPSTEVALW